MLQNWLDSAMEKFMIDFAVLIDKLV